MNGAASEAAPSGSADRAASVEAPHAAPTETAVPVGNAAFKAPAVEDRLNTKRSGWRDWCRQLFADFCNDQPGHQLAQLYYGIAIIALIGSGLAGAWGLGKYLWLGSTPAQAFPWTAISNELTKTNPPDEQKRALERIRELIVKLTELRNREPKLAAEIDAAFRDFGNGDTAKAEELLRRKIEQSPAATRSQREQKAEFQRYLAAVVFVHSKGEAFQELQAAVETDPESFGVWYDLGDVALAVGSSAEAERAFREAMRLARGQGNAAREAASLLRFGEVLTLRGSHAAAAASYDQALRLTEQELQRDGGNPEPAARKARILALLGNYRTSVGDRDAALKSYQDSLGIRMGLVKRDPSSAEWQRDLAVSHDSIGNILKDKGDRDGALKSHRNALAIREKLAEADPSRTQWQRDLSVSYERIGDILLDKGDRDGALKAYRDDLAIAKALVERDPSQTEWQRDLSITYERIGNMLRDGGDLEAALKTFQDALEIARKLAERDPLHTMWQRDLSITYNKVGDVLRAQGDRDSALKAYQDSLAIRQKLMERDASQAEWQRDLAVSYERIGVVLIAKDDRDGALKAFQDSLAIRKKLAERDPSHTGWQRDLSFMHGEIGDLHRAAGNRAAALEAYRQSLAIDRKLAERDGDMVMWQIDLIVSLSRMVEEGVDARENMQAIVDIYERLDKKGVLSAKQRERFAEARAKLEQLN